MMLFCHYFVLLGPDTLTSLTPPHSHPPELSGVLHQCHILASEMVHFIHQMQYYITFEVRLVAEVVCGGFWGGGDGQTSLGNFELC